MTLARVPPLAWIVLLALAAAPLVPATPEFFVTLLNEIGIASLVALGLVLLTGVGGMTSFGQASFVGIGAYASAVLTTRYGWSPWETLPVALIATGIAALAIGAITVRLAGHYLPLGTIAWGISLYYLFGNLDWLGSHDGISGVPPLSIFGHSLIEGRQFFYVVWLFVVIALAGVTNLLQSRPGRAIRALRNGTLAAESCGVDTARSKLVVFVVAAVLAGAAGWLYAHFQRAVNPTAFNISAGIQYLLMAVVGGAGHVLGAVLGAALVTLVNDQIQNIAPRIFGASGNYEAIVFGVLLVVLLQSAREGLWPFLSRLLPARAPTGGIPAAPPLPRRTLRAPGGDVFAAKGLRKHFGGLVAVNDVDLAVRAGEIVALIGPNGAGKSTLFNLVTGVLPPSGGTMRFAGAPIDGLGARGIAALGLARTFQHVKLSPDMSVLDNVALGAHLRGTNGIARSLLRLNGVEERSLLSEAARQIARVGLTDVMHAPAGSLALGPSRLVEVARALCLDPALLLLDEPAAGLRFREKQALADLLRQLESGGRERAARRT